MDFSFSSFSFLSALKGKLQVYPATDLFSPREVHHNKLAFTTGAGHSVVGWIWQVRVPLVILGNNYLLRRFPVLPALPYLDFSSELTESSHFVLEISVLVPEQAIVPKIAHEFCSFLKARIPSDPGFTLLQRLTCKLLDEGSLRIIHGSSHLPEYLIGKPFHLGGILGVAPSSARVSIKLCGL